MLPIHERPDLSRRVAIAQFVEKLSVLSAEFTRRFADFEAQKCRFVLLTNPFAVNVKSAPTNLQMELIELQCSDAQVKV